MQRRQCIVLQISAWGPVSLVALALLAHPKQLMYIFVPFYPYNSIRSFALLRNMRKLSSLLIQLKFMYTNKMLLPYLAAVTG
jgi:hypothetical protein